MNNLVLTTAFHCQYVCWWKIPTKAEQIVTLSPSPEDHKHPLTHCLIG